MFQYYIIMVLKIDLDESAEIKLTAVDFIAEIQTVIVAVAHPIIDDTKAILA